MRFEGVSLESLAFVIPPERWTSESIEKKLAPLYKRLGLPFGRLELMTGIRERCFWRHSMLPSQASALAWRKSIKKIKI